MWMPLLAGPQKEDVTKVLCLCAMERDSDRHREHSYQSPWDGCENGRSLAGCSQGERTMLVGDVPGSNHGCWMPIGAVRSTFLEQWKRVH